MGKIVKRSALLKTSAATDVKRSAGKVAITGLQEFLFKNLVSAQQKYYRAEVVQVATAGAGSYTPAGGTPYKIKLINEAFGREGSKMAYEKTYTYTTPSDITVLGATEALQREAIHVALIADINADARNFVVAATLAGGTGFTITDDAGYYPPMLNGATNGRQGAPIVIAATNADGSGFATSSCTITTAAVYSYGVGTTMANNVAVMYNYTGNLISGSLDSPVDASGNPPVAGQQYDSFNFQVVIDNPIPETSSAIFGFKLSEQVVFVDNGLGTATTNLAGFKAFEREAQRVIFDLFKNDPNSVQEWFDKPIAFQGPLGAAPAGTANALGWMVSPYGSLNITNIGTQTIVAPVLNATGLLIDQDDTATEGAHVSANEQTLGVQQFVVGKQPFSVVARVVMADWTDAAFKIGFCKKQAYDATFNNFTDIAAIGNGSSAAGTTWINGDLFTTNAGLNAAAHVQAISAVAPADGVSVELRLNVAMDGTVTAFVDNVSYPIYSTGTTTMIFDAGDALIPFYRHVNIGGGDPAVSISKFVAVADNTWKI
jgi:hypothetical protein